LVVERLPAYAPELNPVEKLWANLKGAELANLANLARRALGVDRLHRLNGRRMPEKQRSQCA
jgi:transposase